MRLKAKDLHNGLTFIEIETNEGLYIALTFTKESIEEILSGSLWRSDNKGNDFIINKDGDRLHITSLVDSMSNMQALFEVNIRFDDFRRVVEG